MVIDEPIDLLAARLGDEACVIVTVAATQGSVPRENGAWMGVFDAMVVGTVGGGQLELQAIAHARMLLRGDEGDLLVRYPLGPGLGQCCGGAMQLRFERIARGQGDALRRRLARSGPPVALFGGGHVGRAVVRILGTLPFSVLWVDSRDEAFPAELPSNVLAEHSDPVQGAVAQLASGSLVLVMSFSHAEDLDIVAACLKRVRAQADLPYLGLIGSKTKWATFRHQLEARGFSADELAHVTSPIGLPGVAGKEPEVIAVAVAAQLLQVTGKGRSS